MLIDNKKNLIVVRVDKIGGSGSGRMTSLFQESLAVVKIKICSIILASCMLRANPSHRTDQLLLRKRSTFRAEFHVKILKMERGISNYLISLNTTVIVL